MARGYDLLQAMGSAPARRLLTRDGDTAYRGFDTQAFDANLLWRSYVGDKTHLWWEFASTEPTTPSVRKSLLRTIQLAALPAPPRADAWPNYARQDLHELQRLNTALAAWALLRRDRTAPAGGANDPRGTDRQGGASGTGPSSSWMPESAVERPRGDLPQRGYVDPFPDVFDHLARTADQMRQALRLARDVPPAFADEAQTLADLYGRLAGIARREIAVPEKGLPDQDRRLIADWGGTLRRALALPQPRMRPPLGASGEEPEARWFATDAPVAGLSALAGAQGQCLQMAVGPMKVLRTVAPVAPGANADVWGAVLPYSEWRCAWVERLDAAGWVAGQTPPESASRTDVNARDPLVLREVRELATRGRKIEIPAPAATIEESDGEPALALPPSAP